MTGRARVITASNRAAAGVYPDRSGPLIASGCASAASARPTRSWCPTASRSARRLRAAIADGVDVVITTGGTGISPTDATPEVTRGLLDYEVPGLADAIRAAGAPTVPTAVLSRGVTGVAGRTLVINLPGSTGGVRDGLSVLAEVLQHAVDQLRGSADHRDGARRAPAAPHPAGGPGGVSGDRGTAAGAVVRAAVGEHRWTSPSTPRWSSGPRPAPWSPSRASCATTTAAGRC